MTQGRAWFFAIENAVCREENGLAEGEIRVCRLELGVFALEFFVTFP